jgi:hypothetical protein
VALYRTPAVGEVAAGLYRTPVAVAVAAQVKPCPEATPARMVAAAEAVNRPGEVVPAPMGRCSSGVDRRHSGTFPCLRRGSSSRLVANIRSPATSFWRVSAGSITSSM